MRYRLLVKNAPSRKADGQEFVVAITRDVTHAAFRRDDESVRVIAAGECVACDYHSEIGVKHDQFIVRLDRNVDSIGDGIVADIPDFAASGDPTGELVIARIDNRYGSPEFIRDEHTMDFRIVCNAIGENPSG